MDQLKEIVCSLKDEEVKQVKKYIKRKSAKKDRKDLLLFDILREESSYNTAEIIEKLYHGGKIDAYHQLRRNLNLHLEDYICQQDLDEDEVMVVLKYILIANYFFSTKLIKEAWKYLTIAENKAIEGEHFNLLNHIYYIQIANAYRENSPNILAVIEKREKNYDRANHDALSNIVFNLLRYDLKRDDKNLVKYDIEHHIKKYLKEYNLYADAKTNTRLEFPIIEIVSNTMIEKNQFIKLEKYIYPKYLELEKNNVFDRSNHNHKIKILELLCYTLLKNKKYNIAEHYHKILQDDLFKYDKKFYHLVVHNVTVLSDIYICTNRKLESIKILEDILENPPYDLAANDHILIRVNLASSYFINNEVSRSVKMLFALNEMDKDIAKIFGINHLLIKEIAECLIHTEIGNNFYAENRIKAIRRKFSDLLNTERFQRDKLFLSLLIKINKDDYVFTKSKFIDEVKKFIDLKPLQPAASEFISYNAWLKSKIDRGSYYDWYQEMLESSEPE